MMKRLMTVMAVLFLAQIGIFAQQPPKTEGYEERRTTNGVLQYKAIDSNGDGQFDTFYYYDTKGQLIRQEIDSNYDGKIDIIIHYVDGVYISMIEKDIDGDGSFREKKRFE